MASNSLGLGRGLDALIRETSGASKAEGSIEVVPVKDISPNPKQPRRRFTEKALEELAASIRSQGLLQPIVVRALGDAYPGKYEIVAGERRWRASQLAGLSEVPVVIRNFSDLETLAAALVENLQREDLNPLEEARGMHMLKEEFGLSQEDLAQRLGKSRSAVANSLRLLSLPESFRKDIAEERLSAGHARALLSITSERAQEYLRNLILEENLSVREAEGLAATWKQTGRFRPDTTVSPIRDELRDAFSPESGPAQNTADGQALDGRAPASAEELPGAVKKPTKPQSATLLEVQNIINALLEASVRVTGKETKGRISISYNSREELDSILNKLALAAGPSAGRDILAATIRSELEGSDAKPLTHAANHVLTSQRNMALEPSPDKAMLEEGGGTRSFPAEPAKAPASEEDQ